MCLGVPGRIESIESDHVLDHRLGYRGQVSFGGITQEVHLGFVPEAQVGDYVIVHVGVAISRLDEEEALRTLSLIRELEESRADEVYR